MQKPSLKKRILQIFLILVLIMVSGYLYLSFVFIPHKLKNILAGKAEEFLHRKVSLESIDVDLIKGITIKNLSIADSGKENNPFVNVREINFRILFTPTFKNKIILIPHLEIQSPEIYITRRTESQWNFSDLLPTPSSKPGAKSDLQFALQKIIVTDGEIHFTDQSKETIYKEMIGQLQLEASVSLSQKIQFDVKTALTNHQSPLTLKGEFDIPSQKGQAQITVKNIYPTEYLSLFLDEKMNVLKTGIVSQVDFKINHSRTKTDISGSADLVQAKLILTPDQIIEGNFHLPRFSASYSKDNISLQGEAKIQALSLNIPPLSIQQADVDAQIDSLNISNTAISYKGNLTSKNLNLKNAPDMNIIGDVKLSDFNAVKNNDNISLNGDMVLDNASIQITPLQKLQGDIHLSKAGISITEEAIQLKGDLSITDTQAEFTQDKQKIQLSGDIKAKELNLVKNQNNIEVSSALEVKNAALDLGDEMTFKDSFTSTLTLKGNIQEPTQMLYLGSVQFTDASLTGLPTVQSIEHLKGKIDLENDKSTFTSVSFQAQNIPVNINGQISNFSKPIGVLFINIPTINLENLTPIMTQIVKDLPVTLTGSADLKADIKGPLMDILSADINAVSHFSNINITSDKLPYPVTQMSGELTASKNKADLKNTKLTVLNKEYSINAHVEDFKNPDLTAKIDSEDLSFNAEAKMSGELIQISRLEGKYFNSSFNIRGNAEIPKNHDPLLDLTGDVKLSFNDLKNIPQLAEQLKQFNPVGDLSIDGKFKGSPKDIKNWNTLINVTSSRVSVMNIPIQEIKAHYAQSDISPKGRLEASALIYDGNFSTNATLDVFDPELPIQLSANLDRLNLSLLRENLKSDANNLAGYVSSSIDVTGPIKNTDALKGEGSLVIVEGYLGQLNFFNGILGALLVIPEFKNMLITDASVNFYIQDGKILSDNILLSSPTIQLNGKGWVDFKSNINVEVSPNLSQIELVKSGSAKQFPTELLSSAISVKCTGTASKPQCGLNNTPGKILQGTTDILKEGIKSVGGILEEIF